MQRAGGYKVAHLNVAIGDSHGAHGARQATGRAQLGVVLRHQQVRARLAIGTQHGGQHGSQLVYGVQALYHRVQWLAHLGYGFGYLTNMSGGQVVDGGGALANHGLHALQGVDYILQRLHVDGLVLQKSLGVQSSQAVAGRHQGVLH